MRGINSGRGQPTVPKLGIVLALLVLGALVGAIIFGPQLAHFTMSDKELSAISPADRLTAYNNIRTMLVQAIVGSLFLVTSYFAWKNYRLNREQTEISRRSQQTERLVRALGHLDKDKEIAVQLAGIYSLRQLGQTSPADRQSIIDLLITLLRERAQQSTGGELCPPSENSPLVRGIIVSVVYLSSLDQSPAFLQLDDLDLRGINMGAAEMNDYHLRRSWLDGFTFSGSLSGALLENARLSGAKMTGAQLRGASLKAADLRRSAAYQQPARLDNAKLNGANLEYAHLEGVNFKLAEFQAAPSTGQGKQRRSRAASLVGAYMHGADLVGANLEILGR